MTRRFLDCFFLAAVFLSAQISARADGALAKSAILENDVAYLRVGEVEKNLADEIQSAQNALAATNQIVGTVLDLRFAGGNDLNSATATENGFAQKKLPLAILINGQTRGAAAKLADDLREARAGLIFGNPATNVQPDILVSVSIEAEKGFMKNPFGTLARSETNSAATNNILSFVDRTSEADLVREKIRGGDEAENSETPKPFAAETPKPFIRDPVLARAADFIKGEAILRLSQK